METTTKAQNHEPTGDKKHVAYGKDYHWECSCGVSGGFLTGKEKAESHAERHEEYCRFDGETTVKVL